MACAIFGQSCLSRLAFFINSLAAAKTENPKCMTDGTSIGMSYVTQTISHLKSEHIVLLSITFGDIYLIIK